MNRGLATALSTSDRRAGEARSSGPMPWVIAIMIFLTMLAAAAGLSLSTAASRVNADLAGRVTVQIVDPNPDTRDATRAAAIAAIEALPRVARVEPMSEAELDALLSPWLGEGQEELDIALPALIDVDLAAGADQRAGVSAIRAALAQVSPDARVDANASWLTPIFQLLRTLQWLAIGLIALLGIATSAAVVLASRASLNNHRETIDIIHQLGGTDIQISRIFQRRVAMDAVLGGLAGFSLALIVLFAIASQAERIGSGLLTAGELGWMQWLILAALPLLGVILAAVTARFTVMRALRKFV